MSFSNKISAIIREKHFGELLKQSGNALFFRILGLAITYLFTIMVTRISGADVWGIFSIFFTISFLTSLVTKIGADLSIVKFVAKFNAEDNNYLIDQLVKKASLLVLPLLIILTVVYYYFAPWIAESIFGKVNLTSTIRYTAFTLIPLTYSSFFIQTLRGIKKIKHFAFFQFVSQYAFAAVAFAVIIYLDKDSSNADLPVIAFLISIYLVLILSYFFARKYVKVDPDFISEKNISYKEILASSIPLLFATSAVQLMVMVDTFFLGIYDSIVTTEDIGIYNVASRVSRITMVIPTAINAIAAPKLSEMYEKHDDGSYRFFVRRTSGLIFISTLPLTILIMIFPKTILGLFGAEFVQGVVVLFILLIARQVTSFSGSVSFVLQMTHKEKVLRNIVLAALLINIVLNVILIPAIGATGAAIATGASLTIYVAVAIIYLKLKLGIEAYYLPRLRGKSQKDQS
ncbi:MAG: oligosaccharide flippase family protein [Chitinophagales bacterium]|nr:oligosaccharide flippase family protein [Chitinophagales bacterium]